VCHKSESLNKSCTKNHSQCLAAVAAVAAVAAAGAGAGSPQALPTAPSWPCEIKNDKHDLTMTKQKNIKNNLSYPSSSKQNLEILWILRHSETF
jgi:hypothetical protein